MTVKQLPIEIKLIPFWFLILLVDHLALFPKNISVFPIQMFFLMTVGIFHGTYDLNYAIAQKSLNSRKKQFTFLLLYIMIATSFCVFWLLYPSLGFVCFFIVACFHFGLDWNTNMNRPLQSILGFSTLGISFYIHPVATNQILSSYFITLSPNILKNLIYFTPLATALGLSMLLVSKNYRTLMTPLSYFTIYFCGFHSIKHIKNMRKRLSNVCYSDLYAILLWVLTMAIFLMLYGCFSQKLRLYTIEVYFIVLAGLTMPHMWLHLPVKQSLMKNGISALIK